MIPQSKHNTAPSPPPRCLGSIAIDAPERIHTPYWVSVERALERNNASVECVTATQTPTIEELRIEIVNAEGIAAALIPGRSWYATEHHDPAEAVQSVRVTVHGANGNVETLETDIAIAADIEDDVAEAAVFRAQAHPIDQETLAQCLHDAFADNYVALAQDCEWDLEDHAMHAKIEAVRHLRRGDTGNDHRGAAHPRRAPSEDGGRQRRRPPLPHRARNRTHHDHPHRQPRRTGGASAARRLSEREPRAAAAPSVAPDRARTRTGTRQGGPPHAHAEGPAPSRYDGNDAQRAHHRTDPTRPPATERPMNTETLERPAPMQAWRTPRQTQLQGRGAIIEGARHLDAVTRYAGAAGALAERGITIEPSAGDDTPGPAITVGGTPYGLTQEAGLRCFSVSDCQCATSRAPRPPSTPLARSSTRPARAPTASARSQTRA